MWMITSISKSLVQLSNEKNRGIFKISVYSWIPSYRLQFLREVYLCIESIEYDSKLQELGCSYRLNIKCLILNFVRITPRPEQNNLGSISLVVCGVH